MSGFFEEGRHRRLERSSSKKKNLWYCREFERIFINSEPFCMKVRQSAAGKKDKKKYSFTFPKLPEKCLQILHSRSPLMIRLSSGRAMNETDFWRARFELLPSFLRTLDFLGMVGKLISSLVPSFSSRLVLSPLATEDCSSLGTTEGESAISIQNTAQNHSSSVALPAILFWSRRTPRVQ